MHWIFIHHSHFCKWIQELSHLMGLCQWGWGALACRPSQSRLSTTSEVDSPLHSPLMHVTAEGIEDLRSNWGPHGQRPGEKWFSTWIIHMQMTKSYFFSEMSRISQVDRNAIKLPDEGGCVTLFCAVQSVEHYLCSRVAISPTEVLVKGGKPIPKGLHSSIPLMDSWKVTLWRGVFGAEPEGSAFEPSSRVHARAPVGTWLPWWKGACWRWAQCWAPVTQMLWSIDHMHRSRLLDPLIFK